MTKELKLAAARVKAFVAGRGGALLASDLEALADHALACVPGSEVPDADGWIAHAQRRGVFWAKGALGSR